MTEINTVVDFNRIENLVENDIIGRSVKEVINKGFILTFRNWKFSEKDGKTIVFDNDSAVHFAIPMRKLDPVTEVKLRMVSDGYI